MRRIKVGKCGRVMAWSADFGDPSSPHIQKERGARAVWLSAECFVISTVRQVMQEQLCAIITIQKLKNI